MKWTSLLLLILTFSACDYRAEVPSYLQIEPFHLQTNPTTQGSSSSKITDAWVYLDDRAVGVFEVPAKVPVIATTPDTMILFAGIKKDGISGRREVYPFYTTFSFAFEPHPATIDTIYPSVKYKDGVRFPFMEDFEVGLDFSNMERTSIKNEVYEGNWSGVVRLDALQTEMASSSSPFDLPQDGRRIFLEMDYRCSTQFNVNLLAGKSTGLDPVYVLTITPKSEWNKIYIDLTEEIIAHKANDYRLVFSSTLPAGSEEVTFFFDNIKIVHL